MSRLLRRHHDYQDRIAAAQPPPLNWATVASLWLDENAWAGLLVGVLTFACLAGGIALLSREGLARADCARAAPLLVIAGILSIFDARSIARRWRPDDAGSPLTDIATPAYGTSGRDPERYRGFGCACVGAGCGFLAWSVWPQVIVAAATGLAVLLALWFWAKRVFHYDET